MYFFSDFRLSTKKPRVSWLFLAFPCMREWTQIVVVSGCGLYIFTPRIVESRERVYFG